MPLGKNNWIMLPCVGHLTSEEVFINLVEKCKAVIAPNKKYFVKLSLRSAKDSLCLKKY